ncbi:MAG: CoA transferase [Dehalococcoidia bacterium]|nr:CoA transferase [Dehalococcoidia bacterium]
MAQILEGVSVVDFSQGMAGSVATMLLADNGSDVTKVEPPGGDPWRSEAAWIMWNRGKRSVVLDLDTAEGRSAALQLASNADVVVENFLPGTADRLGIGYDAVAAQNPSVVYCSITGLGSKGAYAQLKPYEGLIAARAGEYLSVLLGRQGNGPIYRARPNGSWGAANFAVQGIVAALRVRNRTGQGQRVETSLYQGLSLYDSRSALARQVELGLIEPIDLAGLTGATGGTPPPGADINLPYLVARCRDGQWIQITCLAARLFPNWMKAIGLRHIYEDERFKGAPFVFATREDKAELRRMIYEAMLTRTLDEWLAIFAANDVGGDRFLTTQQAMDHAQTVHNGGVIDVDDRSVGPTKQIAPLVRFAGTPSRVRSGAPLLGQHTEEALAMATAKNGTARAAVPNGNLPKHPFEGMVVLDFSSWLAAPVGTSLIADLGARVIKIEPPSGDEHRKMTAGRGRTLQGKESVVLDLKTDAARQVLTRLIAKADAIMHNMRGAAPNRLGLDYETVRKINRNIIYLYAGSYGSSGPGAGRAAFHPIGGALSGGALWQLGAGNEPPPNDAPMSIEEITKTSAAMAAANEGSPDVTAAIGVATALALALYHKDRTGEGQYVETTMLMSNCYICSDDFLRYKGKPERRALDRNQRGTHALNRMYATREGWLFITCPLEEEWEALCTALGRSEWLREDSFATGEARLVHDDQLIAWITLVLAERTADDWVRHFEDYGVPAARADKIRPDDFMLMDETVRSNGFIVMTDRPGMGRMMRQGPPVTFSMTPARAEPAVPFGEQTESVLREIGLSAPEIEALLRVQPVPTAD